MGATESADGPGTGKMYCSECGSEISRKAEICPECGVRVSEDSETDKSRLGYRGYAAIGVVSGAIAFVFVPIVFGAISIACGIQIFRKYDELRGILLSAWGGVGLVLGVVIGALVLA